MSIAGFGLVSKNVCGGSRNLRFTFSFVKSAFGAGRLFSHVVS